MPLSELAELVKIGTLFAFVLVAVGVLVLRRTPSGSEASLRCPGVPVVPVLAVLYLMLNPSRRDVGPILPCGSPLPSAFYFVHGARHSRLATDPNYSREADTAAAEKRKPDRQH